MIDFSSGFNKFKLLCTPEIIGGGLAVGGVAGGIGVEGTRRLEKGKPPIGQDILPRPKPPKVTPPPDLAGEERRRRLRAIQSSIGTIPSGRQATIRTRGALTPGAPAPILKTKLGQ